MTDQNPSAEYRWDPLLKEWVVFSPARSKRPFQGKEFDNEPVPKKAWTCPFCPDAPEGAGEWIVKKLPNKYAALDENQRYLVESDNDLYKHSPNYGLCNVILYSQDHNASFGELTISNIEELIKLWAQTYLEISNAPNMKYSFIMENRGKEIGNSMTHPHGQIYSFPFIPIRIERKFNSFIEHHQKQKTCLMCDIAEIELKDARRIIDQNDHFLAIVPNYAHWAFEIHIIPKRHLSSINGLNDEEITALANIMKSIVRRYDKLYGDGIMPYVMSMQNAPMNVENKELWHFHIEYYTPFRGKDKWKFLAGVELGTNTFIADHTPEQAAAILRNQKID